VAYEIKNIFPQYFNTFEINNISNGEQISSKNKQYVLSQETLHDIALIFKASPKKSLRYTRPLCLSVATNFLISNFRPYKFMVVQKLQEQAMR